VSTASKRAFPSAQGIKCPEGSSADTSMGEVVARSAGSLTAAGSKRTTQQPGRVSPFLGKFRPTGSLTKNLRRAIGFEVRRWPAQKKRLDPGWAVQRGKTKAAAEEGETSEGPIRAKTLGNGWHRTQRSKGDPCRDELQRGNMERRQDVDNLTPQPMKVAGRAEPQAGAGGRRESFFDSIDRKRPTEMLRQRVNAQARLPRAKFALIDLCRSHRHELVKQYASLGTTRESSRRKSRMVEIS
jgi:hypothetical protein